MSVDADMEVNPIPTARERDFHSFAVLFQLNVSQFLFLACFPNLNSLSQILLLSLNPDSFILFGGKIFSFCGLFFQL